METEITIRASAFLFNGVETLRVIVEDDGSVLVMDQVAGHFTRCHSMSLHDQRRCRNLARKADAARGAQ